MNLFGTYALIPDPLTLSSFYWSRISIVDVSISSRWRRKLWNDGPMLQHDGSRMLSQSGSRMHNRLGEKMHKQLFASMCVWDDNKMRLLHCQKLQKFTRISHCGKKHGGNNGIFLHKTKSLKKHKKDYKGETSIEKITKISASGRNFLDPLPPLRCLIWGMRGREGGSMHISVCNHC